MLTVKGLPSKYSYLLNDPLPPLLVQEALKTFGTVEYAGRANNPTIVGWADEVEEYMRGKSPYHSYAQWADDFYNADSIAWCALHAAVCACRASQGRPERMPPNKYLSAASWNSWGVGVGRDVRNARVGDFAVMTRPGGNHITIIVGVAKDLKTFDGLGGNQSDAVKISGFRSDRITSIRRPPYLSMPAGARQVLLSATGPISTNEA